MDCEDSLGYKSFPQLEAVWVLGRERGAHKRGSIILDAFFPSGENVDVRSLLLRAAKIWVFFSQGQVVLLKRECEVSRARRFADNSILRRDTR